MIFTGADIDAFLDVNGDKNPLHSDDAYARTAGFDSRVVPGVLSALSAIRNRGTLHTIRCKFAEPLYTDVEYPFGFNSRQDRFWYGGQHKKMVVWLDGKAFVRDVAGDISGTYWVHSGDMFWQHMAIHWIGWFVGTMNPGAGGILSQFEIEFTSGDCNPLVEALTYSVRVRETYDQFGMIDFEGTLLGQEDLIAYCSIRAVKPRTL